MIVLLLSLLIAVVNVVDVLTDVLAIIVAKISALQLGSLNSLAYIFYIVTLYAGSKLSDRGVIKLQVFLVFICLTLYAVLLSILVYTPGILVLVALYLLYPCAQALTRTTTLAYIHEMYPSTSWNKLLARRAAITVVCEALLLVAISAVKLEVVVHNSVFFAMLILVPVFVALLLIKDPLLRIEKTLYRIDVGLKHVERIITNNLVVYTLLTGLWGFRRPSFKLLTTTTRSFGIKRILWALIGFRIANTLLLIQLPVYLGRALGYTSDSILKIYGLARFMLILDFLIPPSVVSNKIHLTMLIRGALPLLLLMQNHVTTSAIIPLVLGLILYLNTKIDMTLYSMYVDTLGRVETAQYLLIGETTGFFSTLVSGAVYTMIGYNGIVVITTLLQILGAMLLMT